MQNKGFTLVELIVVITILAILGTIAFISLQGYGAEAKNSKVTSDLRNLVSAIETKRTRDAVGLASLITPGATANAIPDTGLVGSTTSTGWVALSTANYTVWNVNFSTLGQNGADFKDPNNGSTPTDYLIASTSGTNNENNSFSYYQLAGQVIDNDIKKARVNGSYVAWPTDVTADVAGLLRANVSAGAAGTNPLTNDVEIWGAATDTLY